MDDSVPSVGAQLGEEPVPGRSESFELCSGGEEVAAWLRDRELVLGVRFRDNFAYGLRVDPVAQRKVEHHILGARVLGSPNEKLLILWRVGSCAPLPALGGAVALVDIYAPDVADEFAEVDQCWYRCECENAEVGEWLVDPSEASVKTACDVPCHVGVEVCVTLADLMTAEVEANSCVGSGITVRENGVACLLEAHEPAPITDRGGEEDDMGLFAALKRG